MSKEHRGWRGRLRSLRGEPEVVETDLSSHRNRMDEIVRAGRALKEWPDRQLEESAASLRRRARSGAPLDGLLVEAFAVVVEASDRVLGLRPFDVHILAAVALHRRRLIQMQTGEGKTLAAVLPAFLNALTGRGVHVLTFNDYLARRDAAWMGPLYRTLGLSVAAIQQGMTTEERKAAYSADVTYATAKESGFDFLRMGLCLDPREVAHRPFHFAIVDEADSILIDEARVPLVIAGQRELGATDPYRVAAIVRSLAPRSHFEIEEHGPNVSLTGSGLDRVERELNCGNLHTTDNYGLLTAVNQALHARALLCRDVDYIVRDGGIELVDEFTGRVVEDRRWPDGLQSAVEAKEGLVIRPGGRILGSIALQHFLRLYPGLAGMTATALPAAEELHEFYGLRIVELPPHRPCIREDFPDLVFTHRQAKLDAMVAEIDRVQRTGRPILVGTGSVEESEELATLLSAAGVPCQVLNARNDEKEAGIVAQAGAPGAVTISTNMAGRGTDIRLGGADGRERETVLALGGLYVIGTNRHESRRIDDQLRGRAGRQGDPGASRFFVSLEDDLMRRYRVTSLIPAGLRPQDQCEPIHHSLIHREIDRLQRIVEGRNLEIRRNLRGYSMLVEEQRQTIHRRRMDVLVGRRRTDLCATRAPRRHKRLVDRHGDVAVRVAERKITLHHLDRAWEEHLEAVAQLREGIHLLRIGGLEPLEEFHKEISFAFRGLETKIDERVLATFARIEITAHGVDAKGAGLGGPSATWTYLVDDRTPGDVHGMLVGSRNFAFAAVAALTTGPLLAVWGLWRRRQMRLNRRGAADPGILSNERPTGPERKACESD